MKYAFSLTVSFSIIIIICTAFIEIVSNGSIQASYKSDPALLFFLDRHSSFYKLYLIQSEFPYLSSRKIGHFFAYGFLATFLFLLFPTFRLVARGGWAVSSAVLIGLVDEYHQYFLIHRSGRALDVVVNALGSFVFIVILILCFLLFRGLAHLAKISRKGLFHRS